MMYIVGGDGITYTLTDSHLLHVLDKHGEITSAVNHCVNNNFEDFPSYFTHLNPIRLLKQTVRHGLWFDRDSKTRIFLCRFPEFVGFDRNKLLQVDSVTVIVNKLSGRVITCFPEFHNGYLKM